jgi:hypothetical protein
MGDFIAKNRSLPESKAKLTKHGRSVRNRKDRRGRKLDLPPVGNLFFDFLPVASMVQDQRGVTGFFETNEKRNR